MFNWSHIFLANSKARLEVVWMPFAVFSAGRFFMCTVGDNFATIFGIDTFGCVERSAFQGSVFASCGVPWIFDVTVIYTADVPWASYFFVCAGDGNESATIAGTYGSAANHQGLVIGAN